MANLSASAPPQEPARFANAPATGRPMPRSYEEWRDILRGERLPTVVVDLDAYDRNVAQVGKTLRDAGHGQKLRLATKSVRVPALIRRVLDFGAPYQGLMCFTVEEAAYLADQGFDDLLVAYPTAQRRDFEAARKIHEAGKRLVLMVDSIEAIAGVSEVMAGVSTPFPLTLDVDMSLWLLGRSARVGVRRSPLRTVADVVQLYERARDAPGVRIVGMMGYEALIAGLGDRNPFKKMLNPVAGWLRRTAVRQVSDLRRELAETLRQRGFETTIFNGGGTGSVTFAVNEPWLTELTVGSGFLCSHLFDYYSNVRYEPACFFALQAVRSSDPGFVTCLGGGYVASGEPGWDKVPTPHLPAGLKLVSTEGCGEVQTPLQLPPGAPLKVGDPVLFRHAKAGELAERFSEYLLVSAGMIVERAPTYRGLGKCFL